MRASYINPADQQVQVDHVCEKPERRPRIIYGGGPGATVHGYPAKGGLYVLSPVLGVEAEFLGFDRLNSSSTNDNISEEEHCNKMRQLGAKWWKSQHDYSMDELTGSYNQFWHLQQYIRVGWPASGGVWVFNTTELKAAENGAAILYNAFSMEERCKALEQLGGVFYENPKDCPGLDLP